MPTIETKRPRKTIQDGTLGTRDSGRVVEVWDNELDDVRLGTVTVHNQNFPAYEVMLHQTQWESAQKITMAQGPYTESGRYRIVGVVGPTFLEELLAARGEAL